MKVGVNVTYIEVVYDHLYLYDAYDEDWYHLMADLEGYGLYRSYKSTGSFLYMQFYSDHSNDGPGFYIDFDATAPSSALTTAATGEQENFVLSF